MPITGNQYYSTLLKLRKAIDTLIGEYQQSENKQSTPRKKGFTKQLLQEFNDNLELQFATGKHKKPELLKEPHRRKQTSNKPIAKA